MSEISLESPGGSRLVQSSSELAVVLEQVALLRVDMFMSSRAMGVVVE